MYMAPLMVLVMPCELGGMSCRLKMIKDGGGGIEMLLVSVPRNSTILPYVLHGTPWMITSVSIDDCSFVTNAVPVLGSHQCS